MQSVHKLVHDSDSSVRQEIIEQLPHVGMICQEAPERFGNVLSNHLIHLICACLVDEDQQVRQSTHSALMTLIERGLLDKGSIEFPVAPTLVMMGEQPAKLEFVTLAIDGMGKVASLLDPETAERLFLRHYLSLCRDENFFIRKLCAIRFGEFSVAMPKDVMYEKLLPMYVTLCKDAFWTVRKSCADVIVSVACCVSLEHRSTVLSEILANFLSDESKWVRLSAYQVLGPFISTFAQQFTGFAYNQFGELIMTDQHGAELRYNMISFPGSADSSVSCKVSADEDYDNNSDMLNSSMRVQANQSNVEYRDLQQNKENMPLNNLSKGQWCSVGSLETNNFDASSRSESNSQEDSSQTDDHHHFNPFLYYYIAPNLELDNELVRAAITSDDDDGDNNTTANDDNWDNDQSQQELPVTPVTITPTTDDKNEVNVDNNIVPVIEITTTTTTEEKEIESLDVILNKQLKERRKNRNNKKDSLLKNRDNKGNKSDTNWTKVEKKLNISTDNNTLSDEKDTSIESNNEKESEEERGGGEKEEEETACESETIKSQSIVPQILIDFFIAMADPEAWWSMNTTEIPRFCAFYFPAVVLTLGKENWNMLKAAYGFLSDAREYKVRRTMASSIHEVAMILGEELSSKDLLPIYDGFIKDLDEVRIGALKHLSTFLKVLKPDDRCFFLPRLKAFLAMDNEWNWRFREEAANRFLETIPLFSPRDVYTYIVPLSFPLLVDKVAAVRQMARALVTQIVSYLATDEELISTITRELTTMLTATSSRWTCRQTFALLCESLINCEAISAERFAKELLPSLLSLCADTVPNVRLAVIRTITTQVLNISNALGTEQSEEIDEIIKVMRQDPDRDVRIVAGGVAGRYLGENCQKGRFPNN